MENFTAVEASRIIGVPYRTIDHWARTAVITPSLAEAKGTGTERRYSFDDLVALRVARELRKTGISLQALRSIVSRLRNEEGRNPLSGSRFVVVGADVVVVKSCKEVTSVLKQPGQGVFAFMIDLTKTAAEVRTDVRKFRAA